MSGNYEINEKLYNDYLRKKIACIASTVKVRQIIPHLPCLTTHEREEIEAKRETSGNFNAIQHLLACLKRTENWPEEFISALEACEQTTMAAEIRQEYDSLRGQGNPNPPAPAAHVVTAHVHPPPPPSANPSVSIPEGVSNNQATGLLPPLAPSEPAGQVSPPPEAQPESETPPSLVAEASAKAASSSDPAPQAPQSPPAQAVHPHATPPASPETPHHPTATTSPSPPPVHQEHSEEDLQIVSGDKGPVPDEGIDGDSEVSVVSSEETPDPEPPVEETLDPEPKPPVEVHAVAATLQPHPVQTATPEVSPPQSPSPPQTDLDETDELPVEVTPEPGVNETPDPEPLVEETPDPEPPVEETLEPEPPVEIHAVAATLQPHPVQTATPEVSPPQSPSPQTGLDETDESTSTIMTPDKCPVQDTTPTEDKLAPTVLEPEEHSDPIAAQVIQNCLHTDTTGTTTLTADGQNASLSEEDKPGQLLSNEEPYSGNTTCLEFSEAAADSELTTQDSAPAVPCSGATLVHQATPTPSPQPCQENGVVEELLPHNEPEENQYESPCQSSLGDHGVVVNVIHVSEPPSIQNQDGQTPSMLGNANAVQNNNSEPEIVIESPSSVSPELSSHSCEDNQGEKVVGNRASMSEGPQLHIHNGQATSALTKELNNAPELPATAVTVSFNATSSDNCHSSESGAAGAAAALELKPQDPMDKKPSSSTKYLMTAAGVGALGLLMAWKLKH